MKIMQAKILFWKLLVLLWTTLAYCSVSGINYMDPIKMGSLKSKILSGEDPCNPLFWYPRSIPDFCYLAKTVKPVSSEEPPIASALPPAPPVLVPMLPAPPPIIPPPMPILPPPPFIAGPPPLPLYPAPSPMMPISSNPYPYSPISPISSFPPNSVPYYPSFQRPPTGFVPGIHGLVTKDGGINIMPFSDAYADMLEKHKNKVIRRKIHKILDKYEHYPYARDYRHLRNYEKYFTDE